VQLSVGSAAVAGGTCAAAGGGMNGLPAGRPKRSAYAIESVSDIYAAGITMPQR